ncbi:MAG: hypothetical protein HC876_05620 [Chloroflexaceae bacterium]|nr:hypothetical protein [Chloroflexaceae bacterium]
MNGDGFSEIVVGAPISDTIFIYPGSSLGLSSTLVLTATQPGAFGQAVGTAGDVNGDGLSDILIGAPDFAAAAEDIGGAFLYLGTLDILARDPEETFVISGTGSAFGSVVNTAGDLNGDGFADLVIGAPTFANVGANRGLVRLYYGSAAEVSERPDWSDVRLGQSLARFYGRMVATAGDLNGDGYDEVAISTARSDQTNASSVRVFYGSDTGLQNDILTTLAITPGGTFGSDMGTAGDINGDGYDDFIVGAPTFSEVGANRGRVFVYLGSPDGITQVPHWTTDGENNGDRFGTAASTAGDVNGDGYADIIIGAPGVSGEAGTVPNTGKVYVYYGSPTPPYLSDTPDWTIASAVEQAELGFAVGTAGDVNGDGLSDIIVGLPFSSEETILPGEAWIFYGFATGLDKAGTRPVGTRNNADHRLTSGIDENNEFGWTVGTAGDINGDSFADIIVSAVFERDGKKGQHHVFYSSAQGPGTTPDWTFNAPIDASGRIKNRYSSTAGDVNGDGYADVIVGKRKGFDIDSSAFLFFGGPDNLAAEPDRELLASPDIVGITGFGLSVSTAGDVNGDGFADVVVGSSGPIFSFGRRERGDVFYGGGTLGAAVRPQQRQVLDPATPVALLGATDVLTSFRLSAIARMPLGTEQVRLEWQAAPLGSDFTAPDAVTDVTDSITTGQVLTPTVSTILPGERYAWRVRLLYPAGNRLGQSASRWYHAVRQARQSGILARVSVLVFPTKPLWLICSQPVP